MQLYVIKFDIVLRQVGGFLRVLPVSSTNKTDCHDITEILLNVALKAITLTPYFLFRFVFISGLFFVFVFP